MNLGDLDETVMIQRSTQIGTSATGEPLSVWSNVDSWDVKVEVLSGAERLGVSDAPTGVDVFRVTGRSREDLAVGMRLRRGQRLIEIASVPPMPRSPWSIVTGVGVAREDTESQTATSYESFVQTDFIQ